jgi:hypothetical protein
MSRKLYQASPGPTKQFFAFWRPKKRLGRGRESDDYRGLLALQTAFLPCGWHKMRIVRGREIYALKGSLIRQSIFLLSGRS